MESMHFGCFHYIINRMTGDSKFLHVNSAACFLTAILANQMQRLWPTEEIHLEHRTNTSGWYHLWVLLKFLISLRFTSCYFSVFKPSGGRRLMALMPSFIVDLHFNIMLCNLQRTSYEKVSFLSGFSSFSEKFPHWKSLHNFCLSIVLLSSPIPCLY